LRCLSSHYLYEAEFCNSASGWEKGQVEKNVQDARHRLWQPMPRFPSLEALNDWLERCRELWQQIPHGLRPGTIEDIRAEEARFLIPMPRAFDGFVEYTKRVSPTCLVHLERNRYSVPASFANRPVSLRVYPERIVVAAEGQKVADVDSERILLRVERGKGGRYRNAMLSDDLLSLLRQWWTAGCDGDETGERPMTRHGRVQPQAVGAQPPSPDPRASTVIINADRASPSRPPSQQNRAQAQRSSLSAFTPELPDTGRAIADICRKSKSP